MAYKNGEKIVDTTKTRRLASPPVWFHVSITPKGDKGSGVTYKKQPPLPHAEREAL